MSGLRGFFDRFSRVAAVGSVLVLVVAAGLWWVLRSDERTITGYFSSAVAVYEDNPVKVLGVQVGSITSVTPQGTTVKIEMAVDDSVQIPAGARAAVISPSLVTGRHVQLTPAYSGGPTMPDGAVIPLDRTAVPLGFDAVTRVTNDLVTKLGPDGANAQGALSRALDVGAANLDGNGQAINDTVSDLGQLSTTLEGSREELFGTVRELQSFVSTIAANDAQVRELNTRLADVSGFLAGERDDLGASLRELSIALGEVSAFVEDNRSILKSNVDRLTEVSQVLVDQRDALAEIADIAPTAIGNLSNTYNGSAGTLDTRSNINELTMKPLALLCEVAARGNPEELPDTLPQLCVGLQRAVGDDVPLPRPAEVIHALEQGQPPPVPMLAVPTVPRGQR
ncbi:MAG: MCE family protein [Pseudonocardiaceae bacterium]|nr:MCE family protein [Pseudonocardiaceae bacterium]